MKKSILFSTFALTLFATVTIAKEIPPGAIANPDGLQRFQGAAYNSELDEYLIIYQATPPRVRRLSTSGNFLAPEVKVDKSISVANVGIVYNPDANQYLAIYRSDDKIYGRYLDRHGLLLGSRFVIGTGGEVGEAAYSSTSGRYLVVWRKGPKPIQVRYAFIDGDSTSPKPVIKSSSLANGDSAGTAWGPANNKFLVVYSREVGEQAEEVFGKLVNANGSGIGSEITIMSGPRAQTRPKVGYASSNDVFLVSVQDWRNKDCCRGDVNGQRVASNGKLVGSRFSIDSTGNGLSDVAGPIGFNKATGQFIATTYGEPRGYAREIDPANGSKGPKIELADKLSVPIAIAMRPHSADPQALILTRSNLGGNGVHAHILHLTPGPPAFTSTKLPDGAFDITYAQFSPVAGGTSPLTFELLSDPSTLAPGINGPERDTGIFWGKPTKPGTFGPFKVKVTDQEGRSAEANLTHTIGLAAPTLSSPISVATANRKPTFLWNAVPGATSYRLVVENITSGGTAINESSINGTSFTPGSNLPAGKLFQWRVKASGGGVEGPFSGTATFEIDTALPPAVVLTATLPGSLSQIQGLVVVEASSERADGRRPKENLVDGDLKTHWSSKGRQSVTVETITVDVGSVKAMSRVRLRSDSSNAKRFPRDFQIQISSDNVSFTTVITVVDFKATPSTWYDFDFTSFPGQYVRIWVTDENLYKGEYFAQISEIEIFATNQASGAIAYSWQAPADDAGGGIEPVVTYDLRILFGDETTFNYDAAFQLTGEPTPVLNALQSVLIEGLLDETTYAAAITSVDDAGNRSAVSNIVVISTPGIPPGAITNLRAFSPGKTTMELDWTAPAEDGTSGTAVAEYDVRHSASPIDAVNFDAATDVDNEPAPAAPGTKQSMTINGLATNTVHYFAIMSKDNVGTTSLISNVVSMATLDGTAPSAIKDLSAEPGGVTTGKISPLEAIDASSERKSKGYFKENLVDVKTETHWSSAGTGGNVDEHITVDLSGTFDVAEIRLLSDTFAAAKFPADFEIQISNNPSTGFTTLASISAFVATPSTWYDFKVTPTSGRYVKILVTEKSLRNGSYWAQIAELEVIAQFDASDGFMLTWTAPGDDADQGTADSYDIRYWEQEIVDDNDFENNATKVSAGLIPSPQPAGFPETFSLGGFGHEEVLWIAMKSRDENANASDLSNVLKVATPGTPPSTVTGLQVVEAAATGTSVRLQWIAPPDDAGDNSSGPVDRYDIRCSTSPIPDVATFQALPSIGIGPVPVTPGETQIFDVPGLANQTNYNCVVQAIDDAGLGSGLGTTQGSTLDAIAPNPASELQVDLTIGGLPVVAVEVSGERTNKVGFLKENAIDGNVATKWSTPGRNSVTTEFIKLDFGAVVEMNLVRLRSDDGGASRFPHDFTIQVSTDDIVYTVVHTENDFIATGSTWYDFPFATTSVRFVKIEVTEQRSSLGKYYTQLAEIQALSPEGLTVGAVLRWLAPGDDGDQDTATSYEIRHSTAEISEANFGAAILPPGAPPIPQAPGSKETFAISTGLTSGTRNWFAVQTSDDQGNTSLTVISAVPPTP